MSLAIIYSRAINGVDAPQVTIEVHLANGLPSLTLVGLPETAVKESKDRVRSAILNSQFEFPNRRITINLAPADTPKQGSRFDLAIAIGILAASKQIDETNLENYEFVAELALSGELRPVPACLGAAIAAGKQQRTLFVCHNNAEQASLSRNSRILAASNLLEVCAHLQEKHQIQPFIIKTPPSIKYNSATPDMADVKAQAVAKRALEIAAAGQHNVLLSGAPGSGKTMLAERFTGILPHLSESQALEQAQVLSLKPELPTPPWRQRLLRSPHHTASAVAIVGGGNPPKPGEASLAHHGVLFLDELPEFNRQVLEALRQPLESQQIHIARANHQVCYPADFQLIAAMNPCPCGYAQQVERCRCSPDQIRRYQDKISGPLLDRIDLLIQVAPGSNELLAKSPPGESSLHIQARVEQAYQIQLQRQGKANSRLSISELEQYCSLNPEALELLQQACERLQLSARVSHKMIKVSRSIADLAGAKDIQTAHILEALSYRQQAKH